MRYDKLFVLSFEHLACFNNFCTDLSFRGEKVAFSVTQIENGSHFVFKRILLVHVEVGELAFQKDV
jgi:hypothetical protein